jgi:hypothetical protein
MSGEPMKRTPFAITLSILACGCLGCGRLCAVAEPHASPEVHLAAADGSDVRTAEWPRDEQANGVALSNCR